MPGVGARNVLWRAAMVLVVAGAGMATVLLWRSGPPWPGTMPVEEAARLNQLPADLLLERCDEFVSDIFGEDDLQAALQLATQADSIRLEATVWDAWDDPWQLQLYDRDGAAYLGRVDITNWDAYFMPPPESGEPYERPAPRVRLTEAPVTSETAAKLQEEWRRSVASAQVKQTLGRDGVHYFFRIDGACAGTWSPRDDTRSAALAGLLHAAGEGADEHRLRSLLDAIPPPAQTIPWPPGANPTD